jgi:hypothetical protein
LKLAIVLTVVPLILGIALVPPRVTWAGFVESLLKIAATISMYILYIPLHELTHGLAMLALSGVRPTYGFKLPYAYCGSKVWFDRRSHIITALAPVVLWGIVLQALICVAGLGWFWPLWAIQITNLSGSAGDLYTAWALYRMEGDLLIQDTGVRMRIMKKTTTEERPA